MMEELKRKSGDIVELIEIKTVNFSGRNMCTRIRLHTDTFFEMAK